MLIKTFGSAVYGVEAITITVEVSVNNQGKDYYLVGLPDSAVKESLQRVESAIKSNHYWMLYWRKCSAEGSPLVSLSPTRLQRD